MSSGVIESEEKNRVFSSLMYPSLFVIAIWLVELIEIEVGVSFADFGLYPRSFEGIRGVLLSPFIHSDFNHLINNSVPLLIMGSSLFFFYRKLAFRVTILIVLCGGLWTWMMARPSYHIGASGLVYGLFGFLLVSGFLRRNKSLMSISFLVAFIYGSMVWGIFPIDYKISWEGHLWGLIAGIILAFYYRKQGPQREVFEWEEDEDEEDDDELNISGPENGVNPTIRIHYHVKKKEE